MRLSRRRWPWAVALAAALWLVWSQLPFGSDEAERAATLADPMAILAMDPPKAGAPQAAGLAASAATLLLPQHSASVVAGREPSETLMFRLDANGKLVLDPQTRLDLEKLFLLNEPADRVFKQAQLQASLPPAAARELQELMARYEHYQEAQFQQLPPGQELRSRQEALEQFEQLRALRQQYFGAPMATKLFSAEEAMQREMLEKLPAQIKLEEG